MPRSFIPRNKLNEYLGGTFCYLDGTLVKIREFSFDDDEDTCIVYYHDGRGNEHIRLSDCSGYDDVLDRVRPYLPESQFFTSEQGTDYLLTYNTQGHYKRSMDMGRYFYESSIAGTHVTGSPRRRHSVRDMQVPSRTVEEAMILCIQNRHCVSAINSHFALLRLRRANTDFTVLLYKEVPIGIVDAWGVAKLHSKYVPHLAERVASFMEVVNG